MSYSMDTSYDALLRTNIAGIEMRTPVLTASGTFGFGEEYADFVDLSRLGGVMVKGTTLLPRRGNDGVRIAETPQGLHRSRESRGRGLPPRDSAAYSRLWNERYCQYLRKFC